jgi:3'-5' exoribonuclease
MKSLHAADIRDSQSVEVKMVDKKIAAIADFPENLALRIKHMLVRHHGAYAFGSPKSPRTLEAVVLHALDELDGKIQAMQNLPEEEAGSKWTAFHRAYGRSSYRNHSGESE